MGNANLLAGRSILVVEDEPLIAWELVQIFADEGAKSLSACTYNQAMQLAQTDHLSAAVLDCGCGDDVQMTTLCGHIAKRQIPYMFYTGYTKLDESQCNILLVRKPASREVLLRALTQLILSSRILPSPAVDHSYQLELSPQPRQENVHRH
jgi:DNA-binding NtrC family response regulator